MRYGLKNIDRLFDIIFKYVNKRFTGVLIIRLAFTRGGIRQCDTRIEETINLDD